MLLVKTTTGTSATHGIGLFADQDIAKGDFVWAFGYPDVRIAKTDVDAMPKVNSDFIWHHCYINPNNPDRLVLCSDNARFLNFTDDANLRLSALTDDGEQRLFASRDIERGEELTVGPESDADYARKMNLT